MPENIQPITQRIAKYIDSYVTPDWHEWRNFEKLTLHNLVALSVNVHREYFDKPKYKVSLSECRREYTRRVSLVRAHADELKLLNDHPGNSPGPLGTYMLAREFVQWANRKELVLPVGMKEIWGDYEAHSLLLTDIEKLETKNLEKPLEKRERTTYQNIVAGLLQMMLEEGPDKKPRCGFKNQAKIIEALEFRHPKVQGLNKRTLEEKLPLSKQTLECSEKN